MTKWKEYLLIILTFFILIGSFYSYKMYDYKVKTEQLNAEIEKEKELLSLIGEKLGGKTPLKEEATLLSNQLPNALGMQQIMELLHLTSTKNDVQIATLTTEEVEYNQTNENNRNKGYTTITINMEITANRYEQLRQFISDIYLADRMINMKSLVLSTQKADPTIVMELEVYYVPNMVGRIPDLKKVITYPTSGKMNPILKLGAGE